MATLAAGPRITANRDERFFFWSAWAMALVIASGFSLQFAMGRSSFAAPPLVHAHAVVFMGWIAIYVAQNTLVARGDIALHRRLGWIAAGWTLAMLLLGFLVTIAMARRGHVPFFFRPLHFLVFDPVSLLAFAGLTWSGIALRRRTDWHRRLNFCGTALLIGPGFGRLLPMPLLVPYAFETTFAAVMLFPLAGIWADLRRLGRVHQAWLWGVGAMLGSLVLTEALTYSAPGQAIYRAVTAGSPGAKVPPLAFGDPPTGGQVTGRR